MINDYDNFEEFGYGGGATPDIYSSYDSDFLIGFIAIVAGLILFAVVSSVIFYVAFSALSHYVYKKAGHKQPWSAWIPVWNTATMLQVGGIQKSWIWTIIFIAGGAVASLIPYVGWVISLGILVVAVYATFCLFKSIQAGFGQGGNFAAVLGILFPLFYFIWLAVVASKHEFNLNNMLSESRNFRWNWFGAEDVRPYFIGGENAAPVVVGAPQAAPQQQSPGHTAPTAMQAPMQQPAPPVVNAPQAPVVDQTPLQTPAEPDASVNDSQALQDVPRSGASDDSPWAPPALDSEASREAIQFDGDVLDTTEAKDLETPALPPSEDDKK